MDSWVVSVVREGGLAGIALLMFLENVFPPLPSEVVMPLAGYLSAQGGAGFGATVAAGSAGSLAGAVFWYGVGRAVTHDRLCRWVDAHGTWLAMTPRDVDGAIAWFERHGPASVFIGRPSHTSVARSVSRTESASNRNGYRASIPAPANAS